MRRLVLGSLLLASALLAACEEGPADARPQVTVMSRNLYLGASLNPIIQSPSLTEIPGRVSQVWRVVQSTDYPSRAGLLADEIATHRPDLIGLQEVSLYRTQFPGDAARGGTVKATDVAYDYLDLLMTALRNRGLEYEVVVVSEGADVELPSADGLDIRFTDREVILKRKGITTSNNVDGHFDTVVQFRAGGTGPLIRMERGWVATDVEMNGTSFRFVSAHLEQETAGPVQVAQGNELLAALAGDSRPAIVVGDFNSAADGSTTATYANLTARYTDVWNVLRSGDAGLTCCQAEDLRNATSANRSRIDLILFTGGFTPVSAEKVGDDPSKKTAAGLWPSDHAGVVATFELP